jgi:uncharacterized protein YbjQ (UPF0145 family)
LESDQTLLLLDVEVAAPLPRGESRHAGSADRGLNIMTQVSDHPGARAPVLVTMGDAVPGREIAQVIGIARGSVVRARFFGRDFIAGLRNLVGGEVTEYTKLMAEAREQALGRLVTHAEALGADAVVTFRFSTSAVMEGSAEILAYGTAVKLK